MKRLIPLLISLILISNISLLGNATEFTVNNNESIADTLNNCSPGDTIILQPVFYPESILVQTPDITIIGNGATVYGVQIYSSNCTIDGLNVNDEGIILVDSISDCRIVNNTINTETRGISLSINCVNNYIKNNTISGPISGIEITESYNNEIYRNNVSNCVTGIYLYGGQSNAVRENIFYNNDYGVSFSDDATNNVITKNDIKFNNIAGIFLNTAEDYSSSNNVIYNNNFNNTVNVKQGKYLTINAWNYTKSNAKNLIGGPVTYGNFWSTPIRSGFSDVTGDANNDGICDSPYVMDNRNIDYGPLARSGIVNGHTVDTVAKNNSTPIITNPVPPKSSSSSSGKSSSSSSKSSGGSVGGSPENVKNIAAKEIQKVYITNKHSNVIQMKTNSTDVVKLTFNVTKNFGNQAVIVEELKAKSTLTKLKPTGTVFKYMNIWVGSQKSINKNTLRNGAIYFKMNNTVSDKYDLYVSRYDNNKWIRLATTITSKDDNYTYYKVDTKNYGQFVIRGNAKPIPKVDPVMMNANKAPEVVAKSETGMFGWICKLFD